MELARARKPIDTSQSWDSIAELFKVSRPKAKSAITMLVNDGLLRQEPNKPAYA